MQDICTFSTYGINLYQPLSLGVQITFHTTYDCTLNFENIFSIHPIAKVLLSLGKRTMKSTDKKKHSLSTSTTGLHTVLTVTSSWLGIWPFDCYLLQFPEFAIIIGTTFAVYFFKNTVLLLLLELLKENIDGTIAHQLYFLNIPLICSNCI